MKVILRIFCLLMIMMMFTVGTKAYASNQTGHDEFDEIRVPDESDAKLLVWMKGSEKDKALNKVKWKFFGLSTYNINYREVVYYNARTIFSRSNLTSRSIEFNYNMSTGRTVTNSIGVSGSIDLKISGKIKAVTLTGDAGFTTDWDKTVKETEEEKINFSVTIPPKSKVSLIVKGSAELTNGAAKSYIFGIAFKKGHFEFIDVVTEYYELLEERI